MGHAGDMIRRIAQNRAKQRNSATYTRDKFKDLDHSFVRSFSNKEKMEERKNLEKKIRFDNSIKKLILIFILITLSLIFFYVF